MCKITNEQTKELLKNIRKIDSTGFVSISNRELSETMAQLYITNKELEQYEESIKKELVKRNIKPQYFSELERKVYLGNGNARTEIYAKEIFQDASKFNLLDKFWEAVSVSKSKLPESLHESFNKNSEIKLSEEKIVKVGKMNKQELIENRGEMK